MARRGINEPNEKKTLTGGPVPVFRPRKVVGGKMHGTAGAPISTSVSTVEYNAATLEQDFKDLKTDFDKVAALLDQSGETMNLCQNLPPVIQERYIRQKRSDESCWGFYKRMVRIAMEYPAIDPTQNTTLAEQMAGAGNDIVSDPFGQDVFGVLGDSDDEDLPDSNPSFPTRSNGFNENPGKNTLLMMLFLAILKLIISAVFGVLKYPLKLFMKGQDTNQKATSATSSGTAAVGGGAGVGIIAAAQAVFQVIKSLLYSKSVSLAMKWVEKKIAAGPKMNRDVERFDAVLITGFVKETSYMSEQDYWPEAAQIFPHYEGLTKQYDASMGIFDYYKQSSLHQADAAKQAGSTAGELATQIPQDMYEILTLQKDYYKSSLDRMNKFLGGQFTDNLFCCLFRFLGSNDDRFLRMCQAILRISMNRQAIAYESFDSALGNLWQTIQKVILSNIIAILSDLFNKVNQDVAKKLKVAASSDLRDAASCVSWNAFVDTMLKYIRDIEISLLDLGVDLNNSLKLQDDYQVLYFEGLDKNRTAKRLLKLIDIIIKARQNGELCRNSDVPTDSELNSLYGRISTQWGDPPSTDGGTTTTTNGPSGTSTTLNLSGINNFNDCLKKVPKEDVEKVMAWINQLKGQS